VSSMKRARVYLAGPIFGKTDAECRVWREKVRALLPDFEIVDPMARDYRGVEDENVRAIVEGDKRDIRECDVVIANVRIASAGTSMEILYAWNVDTPVIAICRDVKVSPWIRYHSTHTCLTEETAAEFARELAR
jgi:nucleoside 2-deoxyribosyltransferase